MKNKSWHLSKGKLLQRLLAFVYLFPSVVLAGDDAMAERTDRYMGRQIAPTMSADGAGWLIRKSRETEEQPRKLLEALSVKPGQKVCDFGCGNGYHTLRLAHRVGPRGKVYAVDIQEEMLQLLQLRAEPRGFTNIERVLATAADPHLPDRELDLLLMVDVYHELNAPQAILAAVRDSLNDTGRMVLVEFREEDPTVPIRPLHKMSQKQVVREVTANGFKLVGQYDDLPWQHVLFFARDDSPLPPVRLTPWKSVQSDKSEQAEPVEVPSKAVSTAPGD